MSSEQQPFPKRQGVLFVISAPSGAGKTTLCRKLVDSCTNLRQSVSFTTRPKRPGETEGLDYHFILPDEFQRRVAMGDFAEWAEVHGNLYGTSLKTLGEARDAGQDVLLEIDCQGAAQLREQKISGALFVFILPPSLQELERRLRGRSTDSEEVVEHRLANARMEIMAASCYDYLVVNRDVEVAARELKAILKVEQLRILRLQESPMEFLLRNSE